MNGDDLNDLVSVIVPVYNQHRNIRKCLRSVSKQTCRNLEIIVVDDGSNDDSLALIEKEAKKDMRIKVLSQPNGGVASARRKGYLASRGKWIVFVDSDDMLPRDGIAALFAVAIEKDVDVVCGDSYRKWGVMRRYAQSFPDSMVGGVIRNPELFDSYYVSFFGVNLYPVTVWSKLYRKRVIDEAFARQDLFMTPPIHHGEDEAFNLLLFPFLKSICCIRKPVYVYRYGGVTSRYHSRLIELLDFSDFRINLLDEYGYDAGYKYLFIEYANILVSHVEQSLVYGVWTREQAIAWLEEELANRYLVSRMTEYYKDRKEDAVDKCREVMNGDSERIVARAQQRISSQKVSYFIKKMYSRMFI